MDISRIKQLFDYVSQTGHLYWRAKGRGRVKTRPAGTILSTGYIGVVIGEKRHFAHRICWAIHFGKWPSDQIDHINGIKIDNRICNLREATNSQNGKNARIPSNNTSGVCGVTYDKVNKRWRSIIKVNGKQIHLGRWSSFEDAVVARKEAESCYFGQWARGAL
jgi:hypothetical protein